MSFIKNQNSAAETAGKIVAWLNQLARLVRKNADAGSPEQLREYGEMLMLELAVIPAAVYNSETKREIATACEWFPAYSVLRQMLADCWKSQMVRRQTERALQIAGPSSGGEPLSAFDQSWVDFFNRREMAQWVDVDHDKHGIDEDERVRRRANALSLVKQQSPRAYQSVAGRRVASIPNQDSWRDPIGLRRSISGVLEMRGKTQFEPCVDMLRAAVARYAPENAHIVDEAFGEG